MLSPLERNGILDLEGSGPRPGSPGPSLMNPVRSKFLIAGLVALALAATVWILRHFLGISMGAWMFVALRWILIFLFAGHATQRRSLTAWIFVGMAAGAEFGQDLPAAAVHLQVLGTIFLRLIKAIIAPLLFGTLVVGIAGHSDLRKVGRMGIRALVYFEIVSTLALAIGFAAINLSRAGEGVRLQSGTTEESSDARVHPTGELITNIFPENIAKSIAEGQILQVVVFSILFGMALAMVPEPKRRPLLTLAESLSETMFKFTKIVMFFAPVGVFGALASTVGHMGLGILLPLVRLLLTMYVALTAFVLLVLLPTALAMRVPLPKFLKAVAEPVTIAFATASSEAALPRAMELMEKFGVARETVAFVLPTGYSFNLDGSSLYQALAVVFVAQVAQIHLSLGQQLMMMMTLLVSSKGTAGVARASLVIVLAVVASFRLPAEPVFLLFGIDQFMDMGRSAVNVLGNCLAAVVVARWEGETKPFERVVADSR